MPDFPADDPDVVWHYTDGPGLLAILGTHTLWATASAFLNDSGEVELGLSLLRDRLLQRLGDAEEADALAATVARSRERFDAPDGAGAFFIVSASRHWDSLAMWRCYGGAEESYAVGLDARSPLLVLGDADGHPDVGGDHEDGFMIRRRAWSPVVYDRAEQVAMVDRLLDALPDAARELGAGGRDVPDRREIAERFSGLLDQFELALLLSKHAGFLDERETRLATALYVNPDDPGAVDRTRTFVRYRATRYGVAPYLWLTGAPDDARPGLVGTTSPHRLPVRGVAVSPSANGEAAEDSVRSLLRARGYGDLPVRRSTIPFRG